MNYVGYEINSKYSELSRLILSSIEEKLESQLKVKEV